MYSWLEYLKPKRLRKLSAKNRRAKCHHRWRSNTSVSIIAKLRIS